MTRTYKKMFIHLRHDIHGKKIASVEAEARHDEAHGWVRYYPDDEISAQQTAVPSATNALTKKRKAKEQ